MPLSGGSRFGNQKSEMESGFGNETMRRGNEARSGKTQTEQLAILGGPKAVERLGPYPSKLGAEELLALADLWEMSPDTRKQVRQLIKSDSALRGPHLFRYYGPRQSRVAAAEGLMARAVGVKHALAVNSGTSALIASLRALGIGARDEVIVPAYTFFASPASVVVCNAIPVICEVDDSLCLDPEAAARAISRRTKAIMPVHMRGAPAQMNAIMDLADRKGLPVIEDVAQAFGASFRGKLLGSIGTMGCFSLDYFKLAASGEGGFVTTDDEYLFMRAQSWHDTAACWRPDRYAPERVRGELFCGENYRMSELHGAVAVTQIRKIKGLIGKLRRNKQRIRERIESFPGLSFRRLTDPDGDAASVLVLFMPNRSVKRRVADALAAEGVPAVSPYSHGVRDWHVYCHWDHILKRKSVSRDGLPWSALPRNARPRYSKRMCPRTLDLLGRSVSVAVTTHYSAADCRAIARAVNKVLCHYLASKSLPRSSGVGGWGSEKRGSHRKSDS